MTSLQITYFLKVAECMSFSQAAQELYVSQPSVSRQIHLLEQDLGCALFDRSRKNAVSLTAAGMVYRESFRRAAEDFEEAQQTARTLSAEARLSLRVGIGTYWDLSDQLLAFREETLRRYPLARLYFESNDFKQLRAQVRSGGLDAIVCTKTSLVDFDDLEVAQIAALESRAYVKKGLLRPEHEPLQLEDFYGQSLMMLEEEESPLAMELAQILFQEHQVKVNPVWMPNRDTILQGLLMGDGVAVFDQYMRFSKDPRLTWLNMGDQIPVCVVWNRKNTNPLIHVFVEALQRTMANGE